MREEGKDGDAGAALIGLEVIRDAGGLEQGGGHIEPPGFGEDASDVACGGPVAVGDGRGDVEAGWDDEAAHHEHADVARVVSDGTDDGGVRPRGGPVKRTTTA